MMDTDNRKAETLIERFMNGETSLEEERWLYDYFLQEEVPEEWEAYRDMFADYAALAFDEKSAGTAEIMSGSPKETVMMRKPFSMRVWKYVAGVAALWLVAFAVGWGIQFHEEKVFASCYEGSYMIVDGVRVDDLEAIRTHIEYTLSEAKHIEHDYLVQSDVGRIEQEVLNEIEDEAEREYLRRLLE